MEELRFSDFCANCRKSLADVEKILFVEKELGRCFCCEDCIRDYFQPTVEFMEEEYRKLRPDSDFSELEALRLGHYRQLSLEDPDEIWVETTETGEHHFTFITHFRNGEEHMSFVVVSLAIDGVPSFIFLAFPTREDDLVDEYRRGVDLKAPQTAEERLEADVAALPEPEFPLEAERGRGGEAPADAEPVAAPGAELSPFERLYLEMCQPGDIPRSQFERFERFIEPTLEDPEEIWRLVDAEGNEWCTFIARHTAIMQASDGADAVDEFMMIVVCEPAHEDGVLSFEVVFACPTIDATLIQHFRKGVSSLSEAYRDKAFGVGRTRIRAA